MQLRRAARRGLDPEEVAGVISELRQALGDVLAALGVVLAVRRRGQQEAALAARPPADLEAERTVLAASIVANELEPWVQPEDFGERLHRSLATALVTGKVTDDLAHGEVVGYLRGLLRDHDRAADVLPAVLRVAALARQRRALRLTEDAVRQLRRADCDHAAVLAQLRSAVEHLEGG
jgi:hypothetical protein